MLDDFQDVSKPGAFPEVKVQKLINGHPEIRDAIGQRPTLRADLLSALNMAAHWFGALVPTKKGEGEGEQPNQAMLVREGEMLAGNLMNLRVALNAHTRLLIMEDRVERDGISYEEAATSWERDDEALSRILQDFICITVTGRKPDLHVKAVVEIMAEFWKNATGNDITQAFAQDNTPQSPSARFIHDVLEGCAGQSISYLRGSLETQMKKFIAGLPGEGKRAAQEARAAKVRERKQEKKVTWEAERRAKNTRR